MISTGEVKRLRTTAERVKTLSAEVAAERDRRNRIIRELINRGELYRAVSRAAGLSVAGIAGIMGWQDSDTQDSG